MNRWQLATAMPGSTQSAHTVRPSGHASRRSRLYRDSRWSSRSQSQRGLQLAVQPATIGSGATIAATTLAAFNLQRVLSSSTARQPLRLGSPARTPWASHLRGQPRCRSITAERADDGRGSA